MSASAATTMSRKGLITSTMAMVNFNHWTGERWLACSGGSSLALDNGSVDMIPASRLRVRVSRAAVKAKRNLSAHNFVCCKAKH